MRNLIFTVSLVCLSLFTGQAQGSIDASNDLQIMLKEGKTPDIYIDGRKYDYAIFELLDMDKIESVNVIKDEQALKEYNAPDGVILVRTKSKVNKENDTQNSGISEQVVVFIDGKKSDRDALSKLSPDEIESINVLKGPEAINLYNSSAGAIVVTTK